MSGMLLADGYEFALLGYVEHRDGPIAVYDRAACLEILVARDGMSLEEAAEFFDFNTAGAYVGPQTPLFLERASMDELRERAEGEQE